MSLREINQLPYLHFSLDDGLSYNQEKVWMKILSVFFSKIFLKPLIPDSVKSDLEKTVFHRKVHAGLPAHVFGAEEVSRVTTEDLKREVADSRLAGCPLALLADYRDSFDYVLSTLQVLKKIKTMSFQGVPELFMERLRETPGEQETTIRGFEPCAQAHVEASSSGANQNLREPEGVEGSRTPILKHLETLCLFGFPQEELKEIFLIVLGHSSLGRILSGKDE